MSWGAMWRAAAWSTALSLAYYFFFGRMPDTSAVVFILIYWAVWDLKREMP